MTADAEPIALESIQPGLGFGPSGIERVHFLRDVVGRHGEESCSEKSAASKLTEELVEVFSASSFDGVANHLGVECNIYASVGSEEFMQFEHGLVERGGVEAMIINHVEMDLIHGRGSKRKRFSIGSVSPLDSDAFLVFAICYFFIRRFGAGVNPYVAKFSSIT